MEKLLDDQDMPAPQFQVGDRVKHRSNDPHDLFWGPDLRGKLGTVVRIHRAVPIVPFHNEWVYTVEFDGIDVPLVHFPILKGKCTFACNLEPLGDEA